jgi:quinol monooxygenase YgiN
MQIVVPDERRMSVVRSLSGMLGPTRAAPGCLNARLYADLGNRKAVMLVEEWESREKFGAQLDRDKVNALVGAIEFASAAPEIRIDTVAREEGLDAFVMTQAGVRGEAR